MTHKHTLSLLEASISDLKGLLDNRVITSVELVALYLHRIGKFDCRGPCLNSICLINPEVFAEAKASDDYRNSGKPPRPLEGIPFTVKDSYKVKGITVSAASPAFANLIATSDAAIVELLRKAGAVVLGKTNMPPLAKTSRLIEVLPGLSRRHVPVTLTTRISESEPSSLDAVIDAISNVGVIMVGDGGLLGIAISSDGSDGAKSGISRRFDAASYAKA